VGVVLKSCFEDSSSKQLPSLAGTCFENSSSKQLPVSSWEENSPQTKFPSVPAFCCASETFANKKTRKKKKIALKL
jgi:hypothetical protein